MKGGLNWNQFGRGEDLKVPDWVYVAAAFAVTIIMTFIMILLLPDTPIEFW
jgi:hypothetical protein